MSTLESVVVNGQKYVLVSDVDEVVSIKRFNENYKMWIVVRFAESGSIAEEELLELLTAEYLKQNSLLTNV